MEWNFQKYWVLMKLNISNYKLSDKAMCCLQFILSTAWNEFSDLTLTSISCNNSMTVLSTIWNKFFDIITYCLKCILLGASGLVIEKPWVVFNIYEIRFHHLASMYDCIVCPDIAGCTIKVSNFYYCSYF